MVMLDKDILYIRYLYRKETKKIDLNSVDSESILFSFNEYEPVEVEVSSDVFQIEIECLSYKQDESIVPCDEKILLLKNDNKYLISGTTEIDDELGYIPSKYQINISNHEHQKKCYFIVTYNNEVSKDGMNNIIDELNSFINGLSIDFFSEAPINSIKDNHNTSEYYIHEIICQEKQSILSNVNQILNKLNYNIEKKYRNEKFEKKQDNVTIRKNLLKVNQNKVYNVRKVQSGNSTENILLKRYLVKILKCLKENSVQLNQDYSSKCFEKDNLMKEISQEQEALLLKNSRENRVSINNHIISLNGQISTVNRWLKKMECWKDSYNIIIKQIQRLLFCDELNDVTINERVQFSSLFYRNKNYSYFYELYNLLCSSSGFNRSFGDSELFSDKKSYQLFEIYGLIIIQNILKELGFKCTNDFSNNPFKFSSGMVLSFSSDTYHIFVNYDYFCKLYFNQGDGSIVSINSRKCKPDYIITIFDKDNKFLDMIIIEMKYRYLRNLIPVKKATTEIDDMIADYSQLAYCVSREQNIYKFPSHVFVIFPKKEEIILQRNRGQLLGINVLESFSNSIVYKTIKDILNIYNEQQL